MATIAVGDIHGNLQALNDLLGQLRGDLARGDTVVFLGDYIDRGPDTKGCVDAILAFRAETSAEVVCLRGNHEEWFLRTVSDYQRHSWLLGMEAFATIRSYSAQAATMLREAVSAAGLQLYTSQCALPYELFFETVPQPHRLFFESLVSFHRTADCVCVHGGLDPLVSRLEDQPVEILTWGASGFPAKYNGADMVVYGHWNNANVDSQGWPRPRVIGRTIGLDTISHGVLSAVRLPDRHLFQSARYDVAGVDT